MKLFGIYGASGCGRGIMPLARDFLAREGRSDVDLTFIDDAGSGDMVNGHRAMTWDAFLIEPSEQKFVAIAIANSRVRQVLADRCADAGLRFFSVKAENVVIMDCVEIGEGSLLSPFVTLTSNIRIGRHFQANLYSYVEHDCVIGDFVTFAPAVRCNGNVVVEDHAYVGTGAILKQGEPGAPLVIGRGAVVGMGAVVTKSVPPGVTVVGNPARPLVRN
ncbi:acetyltransferase [Methylocystis sp.]|uniref:acetyltransferase n=1 Tax=Methylocystis sp. TaxID=1911079 RepID=UPI003DA2CD05